MSNPCFQFKDFTIWHDKCAMKVGTDSVLLGAWAPITGAQALDIGCGTGILTLMLASRSNLLIHAVDIEASAVRQTRENADRTPWKDRITVEQADVRQWRGNRTFDTIISNPPFYKEQTAPADKARSLARNTLSLNYDELVKTVVSHLSPTGIFSVILPASSEMDFRGIAVEYGLHPVRSLNVTTKEGKPPKRIVLAFSREGRLFTESKQRLFIQKSTGTFSDEYKALVGRYYLKM